MLTTPATATWSARVQSEPNSLKPPFPLGPQNASESESRADRLAQLRFLGRQIPHSKWRIIECIPDLRASKVTAGSDCASVHKEPIICSLCVAVADATRHANPFLYNRKLLETARFIVLPSLGPLVPGHVMVVGKEHQASLGTMGKAAIEEYEQLANSLRRAPFLRDGIPLEAEHGSTGNDKAGACVVHTHVHWLPGLAASIGEFRQRFTQFPQNSVAEIPENVPYIFVRAGAETALLQAVGLPSQTIRRTICDLLNRDDTDWKQAPRLDWVEETVQAWQNAM
jgi:diadenosine tetraphosphate (Ap4A) HIT family hydrolase